MKYFSLFKEQWTLWLALIRGDKDAFQNGQFSFGRYMAALYPWYAILVLIVFAIILVISAMGPQMMDIRSWGILALIFALTLLAGVLFVAIAYLFVRLRAYIARHLAGVPKPEAYDSKKFFGVWNYTEIPVGIFLSLVSVLVVGAFGPGQNATNFLNYLGLFVMSILGIYGITLFAKYFDKGMGRSFLSFFVSYLVVAIVAIVVIVGPILLGVSYFLLQSQMGGAGNPAGQAYEQMMQLQDAGINIQEIQTPQDFYKQMEELPEDKRAEVIQILRQMQDAQGTGIQTPGQVDTGSTSIQESTKENIGTGILN